MKYKIDLRFDNPLVIKDKKTYNDYIRFIDYIPGGAIKTGMAKEILKSCEFYNKKLKNKDNINVSGKYSVTLTRYLPLLF